jgi:hypothetical protein
MDNQQIQLFHNPKDRLRLTLADRSFPTVKPVWASPIERPGTYLCLLDGKGNEIVLIRDPASLTPESWTAVESELRKRYLTAVVSSITAVKEEFGASYWRVETDRGSREFVCQNLRENVVWHSDTHLMLLDTDGNRFEIPDTEQLDTSSQRILRNIL